MKTTEKRVLIANSIARLFPEDKPSGPCSCMGTDYNRLGCAIFWELLLGDPKHLKKSLSLATMINREIKGW